MELVAVERRARETRLRLRLRLTATVQRCDVNWRSVELWAEGLVRLTLAWCPLVYHMA